MVSVVKQEVIQRKKEIKKVKSFANASELCPIIPFKVRALKITEMTLPLQMKQGIMPTDSIFPRVSSIFRNQASSSWPAAYFPAPRPLPAPFSSESSGSPNCTLVANFHNPDAGFSTATARFTEPGYPKSGAEMRRSPLKKNGIH
jgi:hypothetical protein